MGRRNRTLIIEPSLFFVTTTVKGWEPIFTPEKLDELEQQLFILFPGYADALMGYVLMPSHVHLMIGCRNGGRQLSNFMKAFKSISARTIFPGKGSIWMSRFDDFTVNTEKQFFIKLNYIHENPVRKEYVEIPTSWKWSSAKFWQSDIEDSVLTKKWDWVSDGDV